ncbi:YwiC-like family protein [Bacillus sp. ISL-7]|nr:YwiC-like family protein [Bacillus sp. ISL-7]
MELFLPKQHGAWAMLIIPFWLGVIGNSNNLIKIKKSVDMTDFFALF